MNMATNSEVRERIAQALAPSAESDGKIHAGAEGALAIGMQQGPRDEQQDCGAALAWFHYLSPWCAAVIADGMGGMEDGGWASREAVRIFVETCLFGDLDTPRDVLAETLLRAQREVLKALDGAGGTTLTAAVWSDRSGMLIHTGDTRAHLIEPGRPFRCLTTDHTEAGLDEALERLNAGGAPEEQYRPTAPDSSLVDAIGIREGVLAERHVLHTPRAGRCVMTTDGAHDPIRAAGAAAFAAEGSEQWTAQRSVEALWERLAGAKLTDNAAVVALEPGRALQWTEREFRFGDVLLVAPNGTLREKLER